MAGPRYPLQTLRELREERAEQGAQALADQVRRTQQAEAKVRERELVRRHHAERTAEALSAERERLSSGISGADLLRLVEFERVARILAQGLERSEAEARELLNQEREREGQLRQQLSSREADAELVRRHEAGFYEHQAERRDQAEEEAALETWSARRH